MDQPGIRSVPFDLADLVDRPPLKRLDEIDVAARDGVRAEFVSRMAASFVEQARRLESMEAAGLLAQTEPSKFEELVDEVGRLHMTLAEVVIRGGFVQKRYGIDVEVLKHNDGWVIVSREGARVGSPHYSTKKDAVEIARTLARTSKGTLCVYSMGGRITEQRSYQPARAAEIEIQHDV